MRPISSILITGMLVMGATAAVHAEDQPAQADQAAQADQTVQAIWKRHEIDFYYQGFTSIYTCDGIEDRVEKILRAVGAKSVKAVATGCFGNEPSRSPRVRIVATTPIEATPEVLAELEKHKTTDELKAKVRGEPLPDAAAQFPATWKRVNLSVGKFGIQEGECELLEELNRKVFPKLAIRVVRDDTNCIPHQRSVGQPRLQVDALTALPTPDEKGKAR